MQSSAAPAGWGGRQSLRFSLLSTHVLMTSLFARGLALLLLFAAPAATLTAQDARWLVAVCRPTLKVRVPPSAAVKV